MKVRAKYVRTLGSNPRTSTSCRNDRCAFPVDDPSGTAVDFFAYRCSEGVGKTPSCRGPARMWRDSLTLPSLTSRR